MVNFFSSIAHSIDQNLAHRLISFLYPLQVLVFELEPFKGQKKGHFHVFRTWLSTRWS